VLKDVDFARLWELALQVNFLYILAVNAVMAVFFWLRSWRWRLLLQPVKEISLGRLYSANLIGFMANDVLPARLGELVRAYVVDRFTATPMTSVLATIVVERILDGLALLLILFATLVFADPKAQAGAFNVAYMRGAGLTLLLAYLGVMAVMAALWRWPQATIGTISRLAGALSPKLGHTAQHLLATFAEGLAVLGHARHLPLILAQSLLIWVPMVFMYMMFLPALGLPFDLFMAAMAFAGASLASAVPAAPGYVGTFQLAVTWALVMAGADPERAAAYSLIYWAVQYFPLVIAGLVEMWRGGMSLKSLRQGGQTQSGPAGGDA
jgi:uncharacterized protein (TIRG00374 family)